MQICFKKLYIDSNIPQRSDDAAAGLDVYAYETVTISKGERKLIGTGIASEIENGYFVSLRDRSSLAVKYGIHVLAGVIDSNYRGEWKVVLINLGEDEYKITKGDRIAQAIIHKMHNTEIVEVDGLTETSRGPKGFGSSGK